jgi:hypothetical protein
MLLGRILGPRVRVIAGWVMFIGSLIGWPLTVWLTDEPPFILSLSWMAIVLEAWNMVQIADSAEESSSGGEEKE